MTHLGTIHHRDTEYAEKATENFELGRYHQPGSDAVWRGGTGVPPVNHAQDARATFKLHHYPSAGPGGEFAVGCDTMRAPCQNRLRPWAATDGDLEKMKIAIAGASGLVGSALIPTLEEDGIEVTRMVRDSPKAGEIEWHPNQDQIEPTKLAGFDAIINLAGESIAEGRWTEEKKKKIHDSRVYGTHLLSETMGLLSHGPRVFLCASATGIYGDRGDEILDERSESGGGFLAGVCREWEQATEPAAKAAVRVVNLRFGPIIAREGGMIEKMLTPFKMGLGGKVGSGKQYISWVALHDAVAAMKLALKDESIRGPLNVVSPNPVTNESLTKALGEALSRPTVMAMPAFAARLAFGEMADEMLLVSQRVMPKKLKDAGFQFQYPELRETLRQLLG